MSEMDEYYTIKQRKADEMGFLFFKVCGAALLVGIVVSLFVRGVMI